MVVRTAKVVHMVLTPGGGRRGFGIDGPAELKAPGPLPLEGSNGDRQQKTIPVFPPGSDSRLGRLARGISLDQSGRRIWVEGLGGKQSMLFILFFKKPHCHRHSTAHRFQAACFFPPLCVCEATLWFHVTTPTGGINHPLNRWHSCLYGDKRCCFTANPFTL